MIKLNKKERMRVTGSHCVTTKCPDGYIWKDCIDGTNEIKLPNWADICIGHRSPPPTCSCLDYNDNEFSELEMKTMNACWDLCCKQSDVYRTAKFGKYTRDC